MGDIIYNKVSYERYLVITECHMGNIYVIIKLKMEDVCVITMFFVYFFL